jgi:hypothetical protein
VLLWQTDGFSNSDGTWLQSGLQHIRQAYINSGVTVIGVQVGTIGDPQHLYVYMFVVEITQKQRCLQ